MAGQGIKSFEGPNAGGGGQKITLMPDAVSADAALAHWLSQLNTGTGDSDQGSVGRNTGLWSTVVEDTQESGTAYIVSAEVAKRIRARRYP